MNTLQMLLAEYEDLTKACLHGGLTESDIALGHALEKEIAFWQNTKSNVLKSFAKENGKNIIDIKIKKVTNPSDFIGSVELRKNAK